MNLENKIVLISGANGGLGKTLVEKMLTQNVKKIYCTVRSISKARNIQNLSSKVQLVKVDITNKEDLKNLTLNIDNIDLLINNAGVNSQKRILEASTLDFDVNVIGTLNLTKSLIIKLNKGAKIVNITSVLALCNFPVMGLYSASKSALHSITQALRAEMKSKDISVLEVLPGPIDTNMTKESDIPKSSTVEIVEEIFDAIKLNKKEVYPDEFSKSLKENLEKNKDIIELEFEESLA